MEVDLDSLVVDVATSCWARTTHQEIAFGGSAAGMGADGVEVIVDYRITTGKRYLVDVGGLKRGKSSKP